MSLERQVQECKSSIDSHEQRILALELWKDSLVKLLEDSNKLLASLNSAIRGDEFGNKGLIKALEDQALQVRKLTVQQATQREFRAKILAWIAGAAFVAYVIWEIAKTIQIFHK